MNFETIAITAIVGLFAGWLTGFVMKSGGYGPITDTALGVAGGVMGARTSERRRRLLHARARHTTSGALAARRGVHVSAA